MLMTQAKKLCPNICIVDGSNTDKYRNMSRKIRKIVTGYMRKLSAVYSSSTTTDDISSAEQSYGRSNTRRAETITPPMCINIEKLGLDELYIDLTPVIQIISGIQSAAHKQRDRGSYNVSTRSASFPAHEVASGDHPLLLFHEPHVGNLLGDGIHGDYLRTSSIIAYNIRALIYNELKMTCSAGIGISKLHAKIASSAFKPNNQSVIYPEYIEEYLKNMHVRKINGFGYATLKVLYEKITSESDLYFSDLVEEEHPAQDDDFKTQDHAKADLLATENTPLTVSKVLSRSSEADFAAWFGQPKGHQLWSLMHGHDELPVVQSPEHPSQVSIEDSFLVCATIQDAQNMLSQLCNGMLSRLRSDLMDDSAEWQIYPTSLTLTIRLKPDQDRSKEPLRTKRESKRMSIPVELFDMSLSDVQRCKTLLNAVMNLLYALLGGRVADFNCTLFNISVSDMSSRPPAQSILKWARSTTDQSLRPMTPVNSESLSSASLVTSPFEPNRQSSFEAVDCVIETSHDLYGFFCLDCNTYIRLEEDHVEGHNADSF